MTRRSPFRRRTRSVPPVRRLLGSASPDGHNRPVLGRRSGGDAPTEGPSDRGRGRGGTAVDDARDPAGRGRPAALRRRPRPVPRDDARRLLLPRRRVAVPLRQRRGPAADGADAGGAGRRLALGDVPGDGGERLRDPLPDGGGHRPAALLRGPRARARGRAGSRSGSGPGRTGWPSTSSTSPTGATPRRPPAGRPPARRCSRGSAPSSPVSSTCSRRSAGWRSWSCRCSPTAASSRWSTGRAGPATSARGTGTRRGDR